MHVRIINVKSLNLNEKYKSMPLTLRINLTGIYFKSSQQIFIRLQIAMLHL